MFNARELRAFVANRNSSAVSNAHYHQYMVTGVFALRPLTSKTIAAPSPTRTYLDSLGANRNSSATSTTHPVHTTLHADHNGSTLGEPRARA